MQPAIGPCLATERFRFGWVHLSCSFQRGNVLKYRVPGDGSRRKIVAIRSRQANEQAVQYPHVLIGL